MKKKLSFFTFHLPLSNKGFSLAEIVLVMGISLTMIGLATMNLVKVQQKVSIGAIVDDFIADLREQQVKAMVGETEGSGALNTYGIYFSSNQYTLFRNTYVAGNSANYTPSLPTNAIQITTTFPSTQVVFNKGGGDVSGATGSNTVTFKDTTTNEQKVITINKYGVVTGIN